ncbi:MAG: beta-propeller fold lactonase family protein, partial [Acidobacteriales bacterium]|nr:beta-propeller fold lactonase family protein [Terriglobales bacterium]
FNSVRMLALSGALAFSLCVATGAVAQQNLIYINGNITADKQNAVVGLVNDGQGNLTPLPGSPFPTGGTGVGANPNPLIDAQWDSDGELAMNKAGGLLFAVNGHSNNISAFKILADGTLTPVTGSPFSAFGKQPASLGFMDNALGNGVSMMVVANKDSDPLDSTGVPGYISYKVSGAGVLTKFTGIGLPAGTSPAQVLIEPNSNNFFGMEFTQSRIASYSLNRLGQMSPINSVTTLAPVVGAALHPTVKALYATLPPAHSVGVFTWNSAGNLSLLGNVNDKGQAVCWATVNAAGTRLYTSETTSGTLTVFDLSNTKQPVQLQHLSVSGVGALPTHLKIDPTGKFLYVLDRLGVLHVFDIATDGTVTENHTPYNLGLPADTVPLGISVLMK